jgi:carbamoylphosphate synthase large subunit
VTPPQKTILCLSSYFKGNAFLAGAKREGAKVMLLTVESAQHEPWAKEHVDEFLVLPSFADRRALINAVAWLMRTRRIDRIVALDDYDVEVAAHLREHFRMAGIGESLVRRFRDKLAMRFEAEAKQVPCPAFSPLFNHEAVAQFLAQTPGPYLLKPRGEASAVGIRKAKDAEEAWRHIHDLGDNQSFFLIEQMIEGEMYHVDSLVHAGKVVFARASKYHRPLLEVSHQGGIYATRILPTKGKLTQQLLQANRDVLERFELPLGASHTEFLIGAKDQVPYFIETSARVGGANIAEMVEAATGLNLWSEWARLELTVGQPYTPPVQREEYAGVIISLARDERPDASAFSDPEVVYRLDKKHHIGLVVRAPKAERVEALLSSYMERIARDHHAVLPPADKATS